MDGVSGTDAASGKDSDRGCDDSRGLRFPGMALRTGPEMATEEESGPIPGDDPAGNPEEQWPESGANPHATEPPVQWMDQLLWRWSPKCVRGAGPVDPRATAEHPEKARRTQRTRTRPRPQSLSQCLLRRTRANLSIGLRPRETSQSRMKDLQHGWRGLTDWKAGCGKPARPVWREGWPAGPSLPLSCVEMKSGWASSSRLRSELRRGRPGGRKRSRRSDC